MISLKVKASLRLARDLSKLGCGISAQRLQGTFLSPFTVTQTLPQAQPAGCEYMTSWWWHCHGETLLAVGHIPLSASEPRGPSRAQWQWPHSSHPSLQWCTACCCRAQCHSWLARDWTVSPDTSYLPEGCRNRALSWRHLQRKSSMLGIFLGLSSLATRVLLLIRPDLPSYQRNSTGGFLPRKPGWTPRLLRCKLHLLSILTGWESGSKRYLTEHSCKTHLQTGSLGTPAGAAGISAWLCSHLQPYTLKSVLQITKGPCTEAIHTRRQPGNS